MIAEAWTSVLLDPIHWAAEGVAEVIFFGLEVLILDHLFHRHSRRGTDDERAA